MKVPKLAFRIATGATFAYFASLAQAQTCAVAIQASNPTSVYVIDGVVGTVRDSRTGLMWDRCALGQSGSACAGAASTLTWQAALDAAATFGIYKGYNDWRLPNIKELRSLVEECRVNPSINEFAFPNTPTSYFWSGSPYAGAASSAWSVLFYNGYADVTTRSAVFYVRLVRAGQ